MMIFLSGCMVSVFVSLFCFSSVWAASSQSVRGTIGKTMDVEKNIQETNAAWANESEDLFHELESLEKEKKRLTLQKKRLVRVKKMEEKKYEEYIRRQKEVHRLKTEIAGFLDMILEKLEFNVANSLPFLKKERMTRLENLENLMSDKDETWGEKFRQIFAALQIEAEYGSTVDVTQQSIDHGGETLLVDVLRLGRICLLFQTVDHKQSGYYDMADKTWMDLPAACNMDIKKAISMARRERTVDLVNLPLGRILVQ